MPNLIDFYVEDPKHWQEAGDAPANRSALRNDVQKGLLHLVYYFIYTLEGRTFLHTQRPEANVRTVADVRAEVAKKCNAFGVTGPAQEAIIASHLAGHAWVEAHKTGNLLERDKQEGIYKQNLSAVSWYLWEEGAGTLFPLGW
jgi:hypothetical protein